MQYLKAITWFVGSLFVSCMNDVITKYLGNDFSPWQIAFCRFGFGAIILFFIMAFKGRKHFVTTNFSLHIVRGILIFFAIILWNKGMQSSTISTATIISFTIPLFVLILASIFLQERITWPVVLSTLGGFLGILVILRTTYSDFNQGSLYFFMAAFFFAILDVLNKKYVNRESNLALLFYSALIAAVLVAYPAIQVWRTPAIKDLMLLLLLGIGSNLILYCLLRAFSLTRVSFLVPFRYLELFIAVGMEYIFFNLLPDKYTYMGAAIIIPCMLFIGYYETYQKK